MIDSKFIIYLRTLIINTVNNFHILFYLINRNDGITHFISTDSCVDVFAHINFFQRQDHLFRELLFLENILPNVRLTRKRFATIWGGASLLEMLRSCMWELINLKNWRWDFVLNLSESDFPVKTISQLTEFLSMNKNRNFVKSHGREVQRFIQKQGLDKTFVECETRMWRIGDRSLPLGIQVTDFYSSIFILLL